MSHFLVVTSPYVGHARPLFSFVLNLLMLHPGLHMTVVRTGTTLRERSLTFDHEIRLACLPVEALSRLYIVTLGAGIKASPFDQIIDLEHELPGFISSIVNRTLLPSLPVPTLVIVDGSVPSFIDIWERQSFSSSLGKRAPVMAFVPTDTATQRLYFRPNEQYPNRYWPTLYERAQRDLDIQADNGRNLARHVYKLWANCDADDGTVINIAGVQPMYHHELVPQAGSVPDDENSNSFPIPSICLAFDKLLSKTAGVILPWSPMINVDVARLLENDSLLPHLLIGPQFPDAWWTDGAPYIAVEAKPHSNDCIAFLDGCSAKFGPRSALYISFGTVFTPSERPDVVETLIETLLAADPPFPFIFAGAYMQKSLAPEIHSRVQASGLGLLAEAFVPQQAILKHAATGWFLSHAGSNSTNEAILNCVPLILWPFSVDQPIIAATMSLVEKVAFELIQVRNGPHIGRDAHRNGGIRVTGRKEDIAAEMSDVWVRARGPEGSAMRDRMVELKNRLNEDRKSGNAHKFMMQFTKYM